MHPKSKSYTYESKPALKLNSRIDFFLISSKYKRDITKVETRISTVAPDHKAVFLSMTVNEEFNRGQ